MVVGYNGTILRTTNGGLLWTSINSGITNNLNSVVFTDNEVGYAVGTNGIILKTTDGGNSWSESHTGGYDLYEAFFLSNDVGYVSGQVGTLLKTIDGGNNWIDLSITHNGLVSVFFHNPDTGYVVGLGSLDAIKRTENGGDSWVDLFTGSFAEFSSVVFTDLDTGYVCTTSSYILKTTDAGATWNVVYNNGTSVDGLYDIEFPTSKTGYVVGGYSSSSIILKTEDAGATWSDQNSGTSESFFDSFFISENLGYSVGTNGTIVKLATASADIRELSDFNVLTYPNPTASTITIQTETPLKQAWLTDIAGRRLMPLQPNGTQWQADLTSMPTGIYLIELMTKEGAIAVSKVVKE